MKSLNFFVAAVLMVCGGAIAQDSLVGKYSGLFEVSTRDAPGGVAMRYLKLDITSVEGGRVSGTVTPTYERSSCKGTSPIEGTYKEKQLVLRMRQGGSTSDCSLTLRLTVDGNKLTGTTGSGRRVDLSK